MSNTIDARQLLAKGVPVTLFDGTEARLIYDAEALATIEDDFGSLGHMQEALTLISTSQGKAKFVRPILKLLRAGLLHDPAAANARFDMAHAEQYSAAIIQGLSVALPKAEAASAGNPTNQTTNTPGSIGQGSITSQPSSTGVLTPRSGE